MDPAACLERLRADPDLRRNRRGRRHRIRAPDGHSLRRPSAGPDGYSNPGRGWTICCATAPCWPHGQSSARRVPAPASGRTLLGLNALTTEEVERIRGSFIAAATQAELAGFDGVGIHGAFGWILSEFLSPLLNDRTDKYGGSLENRARLTVEVIEGVRRAFGDHFQIGWRLSVERYGLLLDELRDITADILGRELIDYLDLALWDCAQIVLEGAFQGQTMLSVFANIPRKRVRLGVAGEIMITRRAAKPREEGSDFVLVGWQGSCSGTFRSALGRIRTTTVRNCR